MTDITTKFKLSQFIDQPGGNSKKCHSNSRISGRNETKISFGTEIHSPSTISPLSQQWNTWALFTSPGKHLKGRFPSSI